jgi:hypothetical protein
MRHALRFSLLVLILAAAVPQAPAAINVPGGTIVVTPDWAGWVCLPPKVGYANVGSTLSYYHSLADQSWKANVIHQDFLSDCRRVRGGVFNGDVETFGSTLTFSFLTPDGGDGPSVTVSANCEAHTSEQDLSAAHQELRTTMYSLQGNVENQGGWDYLSVTAGDAHGLPSPGATTLTRQEDGTVVVTSEFNIRYRLEYRGAAGGPFAGLEGAAEGEVLMRAFPLAPAASEGN